MEHTDQRGEIKTEKDWNGMGCDLVSSVLSFPPPLHSSLLSSPLFSSTLLHSTLSVPVQMWLLLTRWLFTDAVVWLLLRMPHKEFQDLQTDLDTNASRGYHQLDILFDDDQQPIYQDGGRSPKRRLFPSTPQGEVPWLP